MKVIVAGSIVLGALWLLGSPHLAAAAGLSDSNVPRKGNSAPVMRGEQARDKQPGLDALRARLREAEKRLEVTRTNLIQTTPRLVTLQEELARAESHVRDLVIELEDEIRVHERYRKLEVLVHSAKRKLREAELHEEIATLQTIRARHLVRLKEKAQAQGLDEREAIRTDPLLLKTEEKLTELTGQLSQMSMSTR